MGKDYKKRGESGDRRRPKKEKERRRWKQPGMVQRGLKQSQEGKHVKQGGQNHGSAHFVGAVPGVGGELGRASLTKRTDLTGTPPKPWVEGITNGKKPGWKRIA